MYDVIVVGAGAAGLVAAGRAGELGAKVLLLEKMERAGRKMLISGKGRCNITNNAPVADFFAHIHPNSQFASCAFQRFFTDDILRLLHSHGCATVVERGGRVFPASNKAADVVRALLHWVTAQQVEIRYRQPVTGLLLGSGGLVDGVTLRGATGSEMVKARHVIVCTGGKSYPATGSTGDGYQFAVAAGHTIEPPRQALVPLETAGKVAARLDGLSLRNVSASVRVDGEPIGAAFGEMLFTSFGVSGPIILTLSRRVVGALGDGRHVELAIDLKPALSGTKLDNRMLRDLAAFGGLPLRQLLRKWLPAEFVPVVLERAGLPGGKAGLTPEERQRIRQVLKDFRLTVTGCRPFEEAIVTAGGVVTREIDPQTMRSNKIGNLYFAGEVIDLDGDTGGFNLQLAFSTGWLAAEACMGAPQ